MNPTRLTLLVILFAGALLRVLCLGKESFWLDEFVTWQCTQDFHTVLTAEPTNPPLYYILVYPWVSIFGRSEVAFRAFSVFPSVAGILLTYLLACRFFNKRVALIAAGYQAFSSFHIYYAQEARTHAWLVMLLLLATLTLDEALRRDRKWPWLALYGVLITLTLYMHFMATFFVASHGLYVLARWRFGDARIEFGDVVRYSTVVGLALLSFGPWLAQMLRAASDGGQVRRYLLLKPPQAYFSFLFGDTLVPLDENAVRDVAGTLRDNGLVLAVAVLASLALLPFLWRGVRRNWPQAMLPLTMATAPIVLCFLVSFKVMVFDERYMQTASPFLYMLLGLAAMEVVAAVGALRLAGLAAMAAYVVLGAISLSNYYFHDRFGKEQWREAIPYLESQSGPSGDLILYDPEYVIACYNYYQKRNLPGWRLFDPLVEDLVAAKPEVIAKLNQQQRIWLIRSHHRSDRVLNALRGVLVEKQRRIYPKGKGVEVYLFAPKP